MSAELARRLINGGAAPAEVEAALFDAINRGVSLIQAVNDLHPGLVRALEHTLARGEFPEIQSVRPLSELVWALPEGMCERLFGLPVAWDTQSESVDIASVDVLDGHVAAEFAFHLGARVRVLRAPFQELRRALESLQRAGTAEPDRSQSNGGANASAFGRLDRLSDRPIPLVKRAPAPNPPWSADAPELSFVLPSVRPEPEDASLEPVLSLGRSKALSVPEVELRGPPWTVEFEAAVAALDSAKSPEQVVAGLHEGLRPVQSLIFAVRSTSFDVRGGSRSLGSDEELRQISVASGTGSLLDAASRVGFHLGLFEELLPLAVLAGKWGRVGPASECYARAVNVSDRPSLIVLMAGFSETTEATRRADVLARRASSALERIVRSRKRS